jgi:hypothetical protein
VYTIDDAKKALSLFLYIIVPAKITIQSSVAEHTWSLKILYAYSPACYTNLRYEAQTVVK